MRKVTRRFQNWIKMLIKITIWECNRVEIWFKALCGDNAALKINMFILKMSQNMLFNQASYFFVKLT